MHAMRIKEFKLSLPLRKRGSEGDFVSCVKSPPIPGLIIKLNLIGLTLICVPSLPKRGAKTMFKEFNTNKTKS